MKTLRDARGQATIMTVLFLTVLCGMVGLVLDVGSWYRADRQLQVQADAAALAGAQALPQSTGDATNLAMQYAQKNGVTLNASEVSFSSDVTPNDVIKVDMSRPAPGFFSKLFGFAGVTVHAKASARAEAPAEVLHVAPIVVNIKHPMLSGPTCRPMPCQNPTEIDLADLHKAGSGDAAGSFGLINLDPADFSSVGSQDLAAWISNGFDQYLGVGNYYSVPSSKFNSSSIIDALNLRKGEMLLFPIYDRITGPGDNAVYHIIGWVGFVVTGWDISGSSSAIYGHFTGGIVQGVQAKKGSTVSNYGLKVIQLVD
jgi:secretion/DNA translocation related TadE-like protein